MACGRLEDLLSIIKYPRNWELQGCTLPWMELTLDMYLANMRNMLMEQIGGIGIDRSKTAARTE